MSFLTYCLRLMAAAACGTAAALTLSPFYLWIFMIPAYSGLLWLLNTAGSWKCAITLGWVFGVAYFLVGLHWIGNAFLVDPEKFATIMPFAVFALVAGLAFFPALAAGATWRCFQVGLPRLFAFTMFWGLAEWLRSSIFTGFPWLLSGHVWAASAGSLQATAYFGSSGLGLVSVLASAAPAMVLSAQVGHRFQALLVNFFGFAVIVIVLFFSFGRLSESTIVMHPDVHLRLIQAGIPQKHKWRPELRDRHLNTYLRLSRRPDKQGNRPRFSHLIWPETATAFFLAQDLARRATIARNLPKGSVLITGTPRRGSNLKKQALLHNSILSVTSDNLITTIYDKVHLVPFGEYLPLRPVLEFLGLEKLAHGSIDFTPGKQIARVVKLPNLPAFRPLICYEIIFPREILPEERHLKPKWLLNVTNDSWFGDSFGPKQHLDIARIRAAEFGLPVIRAANTGISAIIDPYGRILAQLPLSSSGLIDIQLPLNLPKTPYARFGDFIFVSMIIALLFLSFSGVYLKKFKIPKECSSRQ